MRIKRSKIDTRIKPTNSSIARVSTKLIKKTTKAIFCSGRQQPVYPVCWTSKCRHHVSWTSNCRQRKRKTIITDLSVAFTPIDANL